MNLIKSMTGFGRGQALNKDYKVTVELKSVNNRYLETLVRLPRSITSLEEPIKKLINDHIFRGRVDVFLILEDGDRREKTLKIDHALALAYYKSSVEVAALCGLPAQVDLKTLMSLPGLWTLEKPDDDLEAISCLVREALAEALKNLIEMRQLEGEQLALDLLSRKQFVGEKVQEIANRAPIVVEEYQEKLTARIQELLADKHMLDEARFANEVAYFADKASITEELIRLSSHLQQLEALLKTDAVVGRKLDFLLQELNREINTIGSKSNDLEINSTVIDIKSELEKIREQVQNIE